MNQVNITLNDTYPGQLLPPSIKEAIIRFACKIKDEFPEKIVQIILYGSYARGDFHQGSDVDILVLTTDDSWNIKKRIMAIGFDMYPDMGIIVSAKVMTDEQFRMMKDFLFIRQVSKDGIAVV
ncbi:nucleotidyltransferase domain-containing protein [Methanospirillum hungatei]|uniref:nucleotidyltransferase domain-containing protein n=1 Tax=Methanospirillum hungatei TaxID=2203 RepID=UPI0026EBCAD3|nr:nucleotidyltransferase domain-containing protein [Methanospirillum hungatei]MCA1915138.1 nucleotidyltransferase domain-containing protein [Methanospirillum hungatei]